MIVLSHFPWIGKECLYSLQKDNSWIVIFFLIPPFLFASFFCCIYDLPINRSFAVAVANFRLVNRGGCGFEESHSGIAPFVMIQSIICWLTNNWSCFQFKEYFILKSYVYAVWISVWQFYLLTVTKCLERIRRGACKSDC